MYWQAKIAWSNVLIIGAIAKVREKKGDHVADAITIAATTISVGAIWYPELRATLVGATLGTAVAPVAAVAVSVYAIGGVIALATADPDDEGWYGVEALKEYYHDPIGTTAKTATEYIVDPVADWTTRNIIDPVGSWTLRRIVEANEVKVLLDQNLFKNRWMTGPVLPF